MGEKTPNTGDSGIERRDILKGLGFGAMGLAGVGAMTGSAAAAGNVVNVGFTPPDEDLEDDEINGAPPELDPAQTDSTYDIVLKTNMGTPDVETVIGKSWAVLSKGDDRMRVTKEVFEEGTVKGSIEEVKADTDGMMEIRQNFSVEDLNSGEYVLFLSCINFSDLQGAGMVEAEGDPMRGTYNFRVCDDPSTGPNERSIATVAHGFTVP